MSKRKARIILPTPEEDEEINRQIAENPDEAEWTDETWARSMTLEELSPEAAKWHRERKAAFEAGLLERITLTLDRDTIQWFKAQTGYDGERGGTMWMALAAETLRQHAVQETDLREMVSRVTPKNRHEEWDLGPAPRREGPTSP